MVAEEKTGPPTRGAILERAESLINGDRLEQWGEPLENFARIGELWLPILREWQERYDGEQMPPSMVALMLVQLKVARLITAPKAVDSAVDGAGYIALSGELAWRE